MNKFKTNLALALELLEIDVNSFVFGTGADRFMLSRWRNGRRKLLPGHAWVNIIANFLVKKDGLLPNSVLYLLLKELYPLDGSDREELQEYLLHWLSDDTQYDEAHLRQRDALYASVLAAGLSTRTEKPAETLAAAGNQPVHRASGYAEAQKILSALVDYLTAYRSPVEIDFVCLGGIEVITRDPEASADLMHRIEKMAAKAHRLNVVLRTDYRVSDVAAFSGPWLAALLAGNIQCLYFDDFRNTDPVKMLVHIHGLRAYRITGEGYQCEIYRDEDSLRHIGDECRRYMRQGVPRFQYRLFQAPAAYLSAARLPCEGPSWLFQHLPHFSLGGPELLQRMKLKRAEIDYLQTHYAPLFIRPQHLSPNYPIYHVLCREDVLEALEKPRHMHFGLRGMLGRAVYMNAQVLVDQLVEMQQLLQDMENYHLCFVDRSFFHRARLEMAVWGTAAAIGWTQDSHAGATVDYLNSAALNGCCATLWHALPRPQRSRQAALNILAGLLPEGKS